MQSTKNQIIAKKGKETRLRHRGMSPTEKLDVAILSL